MDLDMEMELQKMFDRISGLADGLTMISFGIDHAETYDVAITPGIRAVAEEIQQEVESIKKILEIE